MSSPPFTPPPPTLTVANTTSSPTKPPSSSSVISVIVIASAVIFSSFIYLLVRCLSRYLKNRNRRLSITVDSSNAAVDKGTALLDSLPLFNFRAVRGSNLTGGDCAVCLSKFERHDRLRLLPLCCHAFHAACIDAWIVSNLTCPLCRSKVVPTDRDVLEKIQQMDANSNNNGGNNNNGSFNNSNRSRSFRVEIGSVSRRRGGGSAAEVDQRSYSIGSFEYVVDENGSFEVAVADCAEKENSLGGITASEEALAAEVGGGGGWRSSSNYHWLRDYVDRLGFSTRAMSFRSSGRFFTGSSRRSEAVVTAAQAGDLEANRVGEEISELFRWLSGV